MAAAVRYIYKPKNVRCFEVGDFSFAPYLALAKKLGPIADDLLAGRPGKPPKSAAPSLPRSFRPPTRAEIDKAVERGVAHMFKYLSKNAADAKRLKSVDRADYTKQVRQRLLHAIDPTTPVPFALLAQNDALCDKALFEQDHYIVYSPDTGRVRGALFNVFNGPPEAETVMTKEMISLLVELILFLISLVGFVRFPAGSAASVEARLLRMMEDPRFARLAKAFFDDIVKAAGEATRISEAITKLCRELHGLGFVDDLVRSALEHMSWGEWILLGGSIAASIALCFVSGGTALALRIGLAIHDAAWIANKAQNMSKMQRHGSAHRD